MKKAGREVSPVEIAGRRIAKTFWGEAWCKNLEAYSDYANRLPRGRTYVRNGSVMHMSIAAGHVQGLVMGSDLYEVEVEVKPIAKRRWEKVKRLLRRPDRFPRGVAARVPVQGGDGDRDPQG